MSFKSPRPFAVVIDDPSTYYDASNAQSPIPPAPPIPPPPATPPTSARRRTTTDSEATLMIGEWMSSIMSEVWVSGLDMGTFQVTQMNSTIAAGGHSGVTPFTPVTVNTALYDNLTKHPCWPKHAPLQSAVFTTAQVTFLLII